MSSYSRRHVLLMPLALAACGFQPVYGTGGSGTRLQDNVEVAEPDDRNAYLVTRRIEERLGRGGTPAYALDLAVTSREEGLGIDSEGNITRYNLIGTATYALRETAGGRTVMSGSVDGFAGYSATGTTVATLAAERDAQERLMTVLADRIVTRLLSADLT